MSEAKQAAQALGDVVRDTSAPYARRFRALWELASMATCTDAETEADDEVGRRAACAGATLAFLVGVEKSARAAVCHESARAAGHHMVVSDVSTARRHGWRTTCSCGWRGAELSEHAADVQAASHAASVVKQIEEASKWKTSDGQ